MVLLRGFLPAIALLLGGCTTTDPLYCDQNEPCTDPARPFCDLTGEYPASGGVARTCIADPGAGPGDDAGTGGEPDGGEAPSPDGFELEVSPAIGVEQGKSAPLELRVVRGEDFAEAVTVELSGLPAGVSAAPISIPASSDGGTLVLAAASDAAQGGPTAAMVSATGGGAMATADVAVVVRGAPGTLDLSFGTGGSTMPDFRPSAVAVQADGKPVLAGELEGDIAAQRFSPDGTIDEAFGTGGLFQFPGLSDFDRGEALALQGDGKVLVGGAAESPPDGFFAPLLARASTNGMLDSEFASGGRLILGDPTDDVVTAIAVLPDDRILAASTAFLNDVALFRVDPGGAFDPTFGVSGRVVLSVGPSTEIHGMAVQSDGNVVIAGARRADASSADNRILVLRVLQTGALDPTFGKGGVVVLPPPQGGEGSARATWLHLDGDRVLVGGSSLDDAFVMRLEPDGQLDATFGSDGVALFAGADAIWGLHAEPDGTIFVIGNRTVGADHAGFASRLTASGAPDPAVGEQAFEHDGLTLRAAFTDDGRVLVAGVGQSVSPRPLFRLWR
jgi:uncharacterized delta-60 repeat protein